MLGAVLMAISPLYAQTEKEIKKARKEAKAAVKAAEKEGYKMLEVGDMETKVATHIAKVRTGDVFEIVNTAEGKKSINMAKTIARNNVLNEHAEYAKSVVKGRVVSDLHDINGEQAENFMSSYERLVFAELNGEVKVSYTLVRHNKKANTYDVKLVCYIDLEAAHQAHINALKRAAAEQELAQKYGSAVSNWIDEGLSKVIVGQ